MSLINDAHNKQANITASPKVCYELVELWTWFNQSCFSSHDSTENEVMNCPCRIMVFFHSLNISVMTFQFNRKLAGPSVKYLSTFVISRFAWICILQNISSTKAMPYQSPYAIKLNCLKPSLPTLWWHPFNLFL